MRVGGPSKDGQDSGCSEVEVRWKVEDAKLRLKLNMEFQYSQAECSSAQNDESCLVASLAMDHNKHRCEIGHDANNNYRMQDGIVLPPLPVQANPNITAPQNRDQKNNPKHSLTRQYIYQPPIPKGGFPREPNPFP